MGQQQPDIEPAFEVAASESNYEAETITLENNTCFLDKSFFDCFKCHKCGEWLEIKNVRSFSVNNLWGSLEIECTKCYTKCHLTTVENPQATIARYLSSVDAVGEFVSTSEKLFLCNALLPPRYHQAKERYVQDIDVADAKVASQSALKEEKEYKEELTVRGDFGWHQRANMNAQSGNSYLFITEVRAHNRTIQSFLYQRILQFHL